MTDAEQMREAAALICDREAQRHEEAQDIPRRDACHECAGEIMDLVVPERVVPEAVREWAEWIDAMWDGRIGPGSARTANLRAWIREEFGI